MTSRYLRYAALGTFVALFPLAAFELSLLVTYINSKTSLHYSPLDPWPDQLAISTLGVGNMEYLTKSYIDKRGYAERHGYQFFWWFGSLDRKRPPAWSKVLAILRIFEEQPTIRWVWAVDTDTIITNHSITLWSVIAKSLALTPQRRRHSIDLILSTDLHGMNTGSFFIRHSEWSIAFLKEVYNNDWKDTPSLERLWEQAAIIHVLQRN